MQLLPNYDAMFGALADGTRRDIVLRAIDGKEGVAELAGHYPMSFAAVQKHVAILERAGLVGKERNGRRKVVRTNLDALRVARSLLDRYEELWRDRFARMADLIAETKESEKSTSFACPSSRTRMLEGFRSRWITSRWWAYCTASHTWRKSASFSAMGRLCCSQ